METIERDVVCALMISADHKFLLGRKRPGPGAIYPDCWQIPGGGIEAGESREEALAREVREETGVDIAACRVNLVDQEGHDCAEKTLASGERVVCAMRFYVYRVDIPHPAESIPLYAGDDLVNLTWFDREALSRLELVPAGPPLLKRLGLLE